MKKLVLFLSVCALLASAVWVGAAGDAGDPLASLSYLNGEFSQRAEKKIDQALEQSDKDLAERLKNGEVGEATATWQETRLKEGDALHGVTGTGVLLLAGRGRVTYESGAVVDVTTGAVVPSGTNLTANHRYLTAEDTTAAYTVTSETGRLSGAVRLLLFRPAGLQRHGRHPEVPASVQGHFHRLRRGL